MAYINFRRPHDADTRRRVDAREAADRLDSVRGRFVDWARRQGYPREQIEAEVARLDEIVENRRYASDQNLVD